MSFDPSPYSWAGHVVCTNCGSRNSDPGGDLSGYSCGVCHAPGRLIRIPPPPPPTPPPAADDPTPVVTGSVGAVIGGMVAGPVGAFIGGVVGFFLGRNAR